MKLMRFLYISIIALFSLFILWALYDAQFSPSAIEGKRNENMVKKLKLGYPSDSIVAIMGKPGGVHYDALDPWGYVYCYKSNNGDYLDIEIEIDSTGKVYRIFNPQDFE
jgi:outer membrane protein assembly factor BamE (lipoprotein component of BamABCDE complex)